MALLEEPARTSRGPLLAIIIVLLIVGAGGAAWLYLRWQPETAETAAERETPPRDEASPPAEPEPRTPSAPPSASVPPPDTAPRPTPSPPPATPSGVLRVRSDVPGAMVFLDRKFLGETPLEVDGLTPGTHQLNVSVEGYEGHAQQVEIGDTPAEVQVRFKEVRLDAAVPVVHKHGMGSCAGRLLADTQGIRFETANANDAFRLGFAELERFEVDYLKKNLRVKQRGGRTWNFEHPEGDADALFVFHRDVEKARSRLPAG